MYLIDTDILIDFFKGKYKLNEKIKSVGLQNCFVSEITIAEITYGALKSSDVAKELENVHRVRANFKILSISEALALYSQERLRLEREGARIPDFDLLIGATSVVHRLIMMTGNAKHFSRIKGVIIENWRLKEYNEFL